MGAAVDCEMLTPSAIPGSISTPADSAPGNACSFSTRTRAVRTQEILEAEFGDALGQRLGEIDMAAVDDGAHLQGDRLVVDDLVELVFDLREILHAQIDVDAHRLRLAVLMTMRADMGEHFQIADEDMPDRTRGIRDQERRDVRICGQGCCPV